MAKGRAEVVTQPPPFQWAVSAGGPAGEIPSGMELLANGDVLITGAFGHPLESNSEPQAAMFGETTLQSNGRADVFVARINPAGQVLWAQSFGGQASDRSVSVTSDRAGGFYVAARTSGEEPSEFSIGPDRVTVTDQAYVAKFDSAGSGLWVRAFSGRVFSGPFVDCDASGNLLIAGSYVSGPLQIGDVVLPSAASVVGLDSNGFVAKFGPDGELVWARAITGQDDQAAESVSADVEGNLVVAGSFRGSSEFGETTRTDLATMFLAKYDSDGQVLWVWTPTRVVQSDNPDGPANVAAALDVRCSPDGAIYAAGTLRGQVKFGDTVLTSSGSGEIWVAKFSAEGTMQWIRSGGDQDSGLEAFGLSEDGEYMLAGRINPDAVIQFGEQTLTNSVAASHDTFVAKYDSDGNLRMLAPLRTARELPKHRLAFTRNGEIYSFAGYIDSASVQNTNLTSTGGSDVYLLKYGTPEQRLAVLRGTNNSLVLSWPEPGSSFELVSAPSLTGEWSVAAEPVVQVQSENMVTIQTSSSARYFRLRSK